MVTWQCLSFSELTNHQLYELLKLRVDVFVVEQTCPYPELDNKDIAEGVKHLLGYRDGQLIACSRLLPPEVSYPSVSIGRVVTLQTARGDGLGHQLIREALEQCQSLWPNQAIEIGAQEHLSEFYARHGFVRTSSTYLEDGIAHVDMKRGA
ncbi:GNAT family N-acetyltransferase [Vibrio fluvialis]|nr:GNAT family N-acetyltransferase [Vibrio fluvialis]EKO3994612.1 GNAT family N-acetyltransferase [Vibrio fluvialis]